MSNICINGKVKLAGIHLFDQTQWSHKNLQETAVLDLHNVPQGRFSISPAADFVVR